MPLGLITNSTLVYATSSTSVGINDIRSALKSLLETGYGAQLTGNDVIAGSTISAQTWAALANDFQRIKVHQQGSTQTFVTGLPETGRILTANFAQTISSGTNLAYINSTTVATSQLGEDFNSSSRTAVWGSNISHQVTFTWSSADAARIFFNLGGYIKFNLGYPQASYSGDDATWKTALDSAISRLSNFKYAFSQIIDPASTLYAKYEGSGSPLVWSTDSSSFVYKDTNNNAVKISVNKSSGVLTVTLTLEPVALSSINLDVTSTITNYYSRGDVPVGGYFGIAAPRPQVSRTQDLSGGGVVIEPPPNTRILSVNSLSPFTLVKDSTSAAQTVTLTNNGNQSLTITAISYSTNFITGPGTPPVTAVPNYSGFVLPKVIPPAGSASFTLAYTGNTVGTYNNNFVITSNNDAGPVTVQTQQVVSAPAFDFSLSPSSVTASVTTPDIVSQKFTIVPNDGTIIGTGYLSSFTPTLGFTSSATSDGPTVSFDPNSLTTNTTYSTVLSVSYGSVTKSANISVTRNLPTTFNLGTWTSPIQRYNSIVGMSYDVIAGQRYLTIGYSLGEDGSLQDAANPSYQSYLSIANLGTSADTKYSSGIVAYEMLNSPTHIQFIKDYGVWIRSNSKEPYDTYIARSYSFTAPTSGTYRWRMSADNEAYFTIDGETIGDLRGYGNPWTYVTEDTFELSAGQHNITWYVQNFSSSGSDNPGGVAIQLLRTSDSLEIWNTQNAVRSTPAYRYWQEVYRIPISMNGAPQTLYSKNYIIKNSNGAYENSYGYYFGTLNTASEGSMFTVQNDGTGLLSINFNSNWGIPANPTYNPDVTKFVYLPFYYSELSGTRITNLDSGPVGDGNQTNYFLGFNSNGTVRTNLQVYPRGSGSGGGSGCPDPTVPILMADYSTKAAGDLEISDMVLGIDEATGEVGPYPIIKKELVQQPKVDINFTDGTTIRISESHKFLIYQQGWKQVFDLGPGDRVQTIHASVTFKEIKSISSIGEGTVVKLEVDLAHTYIADGLISHNAKIIDPDENIDLITA